MEEETEIVLDIATNIWYIIANQYPHWCTCMKKHELLHKIDKIKAYCIVLCDGSNHRQLTNIDEKMTITNKMDTLSQQY